MLNAACVTLFMIVDLEALESAGESHKGFHELSATHKVNHLHIKLIMHIL